MSLLAGWFALLVPFAACAEMTEYSCDIDSITVVAEDSHNAELACDTIVSTDLRLRDLGLEIDQTVRVEITIKERYSSLRGNRRQTKKRLLSGLVRCGACGGNMTIINRERYSCSAKRERGTCSSPVGIKAAELEKRVLDGLREILHGRQDLVEEFATAYREEVERLRRSRTNDGSRLQKELAKVQRGIDRCLAYIIDGDGDPGTVRGSLKELENRKRALERQLREAGSASTVVLHPNIADHYRRKVKELQILFTDDASRQQAMEIVRSLIDHIEVCRGEKRGMPDVILFGTLANILEYACTETKKAASAEGGVGRVLLVAGARNQLCRTVLEL